MFRNANIKFAAQPLQESTEIVSALFYREGNRNFLCMVFMLLRMLPVRSGKAACCTCISYSTLVRVKEHRAELCLTIPYLPRLGPPQGNITAKTYKDKARDTKRLRPELPHFGGWHPMPHFIFDNLKKCSDSQAAESTQTPPTLREWHACSAFSESGWLWRLLNLDN